MMDPEEGVFIKKEGTPEYEWRKVCPDLIMAAAPQIKVSASACWGGWRCLGQAL